MAGITIPVGIKNAQFKAGLDEMRKQAKGFAIDIKGEFTGSFSGIKGQIVGAFGLAAIGSAVGSLLSKAGAIQDMSERFDASAESLQRIGNVAAQNGSSMEAVGAALNKTALSQDAARNASAEHLAALDALKISAAEFINLTPEEAFYRIADATATAEDRQAAYAAVIKLMGRSSGELFTTLEMGGAAIRELGNSIGVYSDEAIARLDEMGDALDASKSRFAVAAGEAMLLVDRLARSGGAAAGGIRNLFTYGLANAATSVRDEAVEIWNPKAKDKAKKPRREVEDKADREKADNSAKRAADQRLKLETEIAKLREEAALEAMTSEQRLAALQAKRRDLIASPIGGPIQQLTGRKAVLEIDKEIGDEQKKIADAKARAKAEEQKVRDQSAKDLAAAHAAEREQTEQAALAKMSPAKQRAFLKKKSDNLYYQATLSEAGGKGEEASKQRLEAGKLLEQMNGIGIGPAPLAKVSVDSLQAIGGGGGIGASADPQLRKLEAMDQKLERIARAVENRTPPAPRAQPK